MSAYALTAVFSSHALGGSELFNLEFLRTVRGRGVVIHALVPGDGPLLPELAQITESIDIVPIPDGLTAMSRFKPGVEALALPGRVASLGSYLPRLGRALAHLPGPVCSFGFRSQLAVAGVLPPRRRGAWVVHEVVPPGTPATMWRAASRRAARILTYSQAAASQPALRGRDARLRAVRFDLSRFGSSPEIDSVQRLGLIGDLVELKNHTLAIDLTRRLRDGGETVSTLLVGRDVSDNVPRAAEYAEDIRRLAAATHGVELIASTPEAMPSVIAQIDLLMHLSTVPESFGRVCVEAMAAGRPVVAYDHGGVAELIDHGRTGLLCPPGNTDSVEQALLELLREPERCIEMGRTARISALERFGLRPDRRDTVGDALADFVIEDA